ncbi:ATP-dependent nuclease [Leuconostoc citreum]|uniref:ATP-dependent nuclease n=1 Tax=Leuconostoc citreum TaxID=33964 RepID=UPI0032DE4A32
MRISNLVIKNYRNIQNINIAIDNSTAFIGDNNSGKSNILRALTLPFLSNDIGYNGKNLSWSDINNDAKNMYYQFIFDSFQDILDGVIDIHEFEKALPKVLVEVTFKPKDNELYFVKNFASKINDNEEICYGLSYEFFPKSIPKVLKKVQEVLALQEIVDGNIQNLSSIRMNLLPTELYSHSIKVLNKEISVPYDELKLFKYTSLVAERDDFSRSSNNLGSRSLVKLLQMKLDTRSQLQVEKEYTSFFDTLKNLSEMENIINWQENSKLENAKVFFDKISILPNMPNMNSLLSSVKLGYVGDDLSSQGLGHRNLILLLVLLNSFIDKERDTALSVLTLEEPEAHLGIGNKNLISSFINAFVKEENSVQLFYSTHSTEFINKVDFNNIVIVSDGHAVSLSQQLSEAGKNYLSKNPNLDLYKFFFSKKCILVEGLSEELLIRSYINSQKRLSDITVISFHKGFREIIDVWLKLNKDSSNYIGIVRDFDNQTKAQEDHESYNTFQNICVSTTHEYTLEPEIVSTEGNYELLKKYFEDEFSWTVSSSENLSNQWRDAKASVMLQVCKDISNGKLSTLKLPGHIQEVIEFLSETQRKEII